MSLPATFANATIATGAQLDANFAALGALTAIPCAATGSNAVVLTPAANTPNVSAYANYMPFSFIPASANTGASTARVGSLPALSIYLDTPSGPEPLSGGEMQPENLAILTYDFALNSGAGGFHLASGPANLGSYLPLSGGTLTGPVVGPVGSFSTLTATIVTVSGALSGATISATNINVGATLTAPNVNATVVSGSTVSSGHLIVGSGEAFTRLNATLAALVYTSITPQNSQDQTHVLSGAQVNDMVVLGLPAAPTSSVVFQGFVSAAGTITVRAHNYSAATVTPGTVTMQLGIMGTT